jgi:hypothetical protein
MKIILPNDSGLLDDIDLNPDNYRNEHTKQYVICIH